MSVCAAKVRTALAEKGIAWDSKHLDLRAGDAQNQDYLKLNPNAVVPTLVQGGHVIIELTIICEFIDDAWPDPPLKPADPVSRARMRIWTKQLDDSLHAAVAALSFCIAFRHQWLARSEEERRKWLAGIPQQERRDRSRSILQHGLKSPYFGPAVMRYLKFFQDAEFALADDPWLAGKTFSLAEVGFAPYLARLGHLGLDDLFNRSPRVSEWSERIANRPSVVEGVARWFNPKYLKLFEEKRSEAREEVAKLLG